MLAAPIPIEKATYPLREFVILPETLAAAPVPVVTFTLAPSSRPLAEDYILQVGMPADTEGLFAVCIFATITDEQLAALARALTE